MAAGLILVVDDDAVTSAALAAVLQIHGYETVSAQDGLDALTHLRAGLQPSLILLDWMMPNLDGRGFLDQGAADRLLGAIPIVIFSAVASRIRATGVAATVSKDADPDVLLDVVARLANGVGRNGDGRHH